MPSKRTNDSVDRILEELNMQQAQAGLRDSVTDHQVDEILRSVGILSLPDEPLPEDKLSFPEGDALDDLLQKPVSHSRARIPRCSPTHGRPARRSSRCRRWTRPARRPSAGTPPAPVSSRAFSVRWPPAAMPSRWTRARTSSSDSSEPRWPSCPMKTDACTSPARRNAACSA